MKKKQLERRVAELERQVESIKALQLLNEVRTLKEQYD